MVELAEGEALQPEAMLADIKDGVHIMDWPPEVLSKLRAAWEEVVAEEVASNPDVKRLWDSYTTWHDKYKIWGDRAYLK